MANSQLLLSFAAAVPAALLSGVLTWAIRPLLVRIALAKPNARSSHRVPTPQGAGIAVIAATLIAAVTVIAFAGAAEMKIPVAVFGATLFIAAVGFADDVHSIPVLPRLLLQGLAVAAVILAAPENLRIVPACPLWIERGLLLLAGLWFVNLVNFMDGLDLMTVAEIVPLTGALVLLGWLAELPAPATVAAAALFGAMLGFAPFNRPVAKIFLGDVGSLPIGLLAGWCLLQLAWHQQIAAALLLPLYYLADATVTLLRRMHQARTVLGGASHPFLSARHRQRICGVARGERGVRAQCPARCAGDRLGHDLVFGHRNPAFRHRRHRHGAPDAPLLTPASVVRLIRLLLRKLADQAAIVGHGDFKIETPGDFGCALGPLRIFGAGGATDRFRELIGSAGFDDPADIVLGHRQRRLGVGFGNQDHRAADRQQIVEPAGHRYAGDVPAVGNDPDIGGGKKRLQLFVLDAIDQGDVRKLCLGLHRLQLVEANSPARQQEVDILVVPQQARGLEHDDGIVGKAEIA